MVATKTELPFEAKVLLSSARQLLQEKPGPERDQALQEWLRACEQLLPQEGDPYARAYRSLDKLRALRERGK